MFKAKANTSLSRVELPSDYPPAAERPLLAEELVASDPRIARLIASHKEARATWRAALDHPASDPEAGTVSAAIDAYDKSLRTLLTITPRTLRGALARMLYIRDLQAQGDKVDALEFGNSSAFDLLLKSQIVAMDAAIQSATGASDRIAATDADVALLALAPEFDAFRVRLETAYEIWGPLHEEIRTQYGQWRAQHPEADNSEVIKAYCTINDEVSATAGNPEHADDLTNAVHPCTMSILAMQARTLAGLGLKASVVRTYLSSMWGTSDDDADWEHLLVRNLVNDLLALAGRKA